MIRTKELMQILEKFNSGETAGYARVQVVSKSNRYRPKNILEVKLVENKIIGSTESHRLMILTD